MMKGCIVKRKGLLKASFAGLLVSGLMVTSLTTANAEEWNSGPDTPANNAALPLVHTTRSGPIKPNILNPHPVCNALSEYRTIIYRVKEKFSPIGTVQMTNYNKSGSVPLSQSISRSTTLSLSLSGDIGGSFSGIQAAIHPSVSYSISWSAGQNIGPIDVPAGATAYATYGFNTVDFSGTQQYCKIDGTWSNPWDYRGTAPSSTTVRVATVNSAGQSLPVQVLDPANGTNQPTSSLIPADPVVPANASLGGDYDLSVGYRVSAVKAAGASGAVALEVKNEGKKYYYNSKTPTVFKVSIKTEDGPEGVDRLMNIVPLAGATAQDLGFDAATSTRTWLISLSNPVYKGRTVTIGTIWFADGLTQEGRIKQKIVTTQVTRTQGDVSFGNDFRVDSTQATKSDLGRALPGVLF